MLQVHCPEDQHKSKGGGNLSIHYCADLDTIKTVFRTTLSVNQLSLYGAVAEMCEEYETLYDRTGPPVVRGQSSSSFVPSVIKTEVPLDCDDFAHKDLPMQQYEERIEKLSQQDRLSKFCMDAGFLNVVEIGQYFRTKDTADLSQFHAVTCREYTLPREEEASQPKGRIQGNTNIWPVLEVATSYLHGKYGVESRIMSVNRDNSHSWVRISHGSNKFVMNLNNNEQEIPEVQLEEYASKLDAKDFACRSKAKAKPQRRELATRIVPIRKNWTAIGKRTWTDVEPGEYSLSDCDISKKLIHLLRHGNQVHREDDGAVQFRRTKENLQNPFPQSTHWSDNRWKACLAGGRAKKRFHYCTDDSGIIIYFRSLQGHSGRNLIDPSLRDNVVIPSGFFQFFLPYWMCVQSSSLLYSESCQDGNWRSHIRKSLHVTSTSAKDLITSRMDKGIGFESCSTTRRGSCSTSKIFPTNPTNSKSNS